MAPFRRRLKRNTMPPFRFLDLAPELRNIIYEHALTYDRANGITAAVGLLRTCRQVYNESKDILNVQSTFTICATPDETTREHAVNPYALAYSPDPLGSVVLHGDIKETPELHISTLQIFDALPQTVLKVARVRIEFDLVNLAQWAVRWPYYEACVRVLFALVNLLNSDEQPRCLEVSTRHFPDGLLFFDRVLWPLQSLHPRIALDMKGPLDPASSDAIRKLLEDRQPEQVHTSLDEIRRVEALYSSTKNIMSYLSIKSRWTGSAIRLGHDCLDAAKQDMCRTSKLSLGMNPHLSINLIAAKNLLSMNRKQKLEEIMEPPEWLIKCFGIANAAFGKEKARKLLEAKVKPLKHLIDAIAARY